MPQNLEITILGCGGSAGVPAAGNYWGQCDSTEPKNIRSRCSIAVQSSDKTLIIDTGPDFRFQLNREDIRNVDAVLYTHFHGDHVDGIGDLRGFRFRNQRLIPVYANKETLEVFDITVPHLTKGGSHEVYPAVLQPYEIKPNQFGKTMSVEGIEFIPFEQDHGSCKSLGYRFGDFAYSVDVLKIEKNSIDVLKGIKTWVIDGAGYNSENHVHAGFKDIYTMNKIVGAEKVVITSLTLSMDYQKVLSELKDGYIPAYDGMKFQINA